MLVLSDYVKVLLLLIVAGWLVNIGVIFMTISAGLAIILAGFTIAYYSRQKLSRDETVAGRMHVAWLCICVTFVSGYLAA